MCRRVWTHVGGALRVYCERKSARYGAGAERSREIARDGLERVIAVVAASVAARVSYSCIHAPHCVNKTMASISVLLLSTSTVVPLTRPPVITPANLLASGGVTLTAHDTEAARKMESLFRPARPKVCAPLPCIKQSPLPRIYRAEQS